MLGGSGHGASVEPETAAMGQALLVQGSRSLSFSFSLLLSLCRSVCLSVSVALCVCVCVCLSLSLSLSLFLPCSLSLSLSLSHSLCVALTLSPLLSLSLALSLLLSLCHCLCRPAAILSPRACREGTGLEVTAPVFCCVFKLSVAGFVISARYCFVAMVLFCCSFCCCRSEVTGLIFYCG